MPVVRVNRKAADRIDAGHLWIFSSDVVDRGTARAGDVVRVMSGRDRTLGVAHYSSSSQICLRLLSQRVEKVAREFLAERLRSALRYRERVVKHSNAYRLVHAEGDLLPGLIVDRYGSYLAVQLLNQGMNRMASEITSVLVELLNPEAIVARNDVASRSKEELQQEVNTLFGDAPPLAEIEMNGLRFLVDLVGGQKTGVFLDQRENYRAIKNYARGGRALDCFTSTGGFALHLASVCESVEAVDSSQVSLATLRANAALNGIGNVSATQANVLEYLPGLVHAHHVFDMVVVDPPAFTKSRGALEGAARGYKEINSRALRLMNQGGILVSCSCSHHMSEAHLLEVIAAAALDCGKRLRVLERRTQAQDHPILLTVPETHYLKCLIFEVM